MRGRVVAIGRSEAEARARLRGIPGVVALRVDDALAADHGDAAATWLDGTLPEAGALVERLEASGARFVVSCEDAIARSRDARETGRPILVGGHGVGSLALAQLIARIRSEERGSLRQLSIRKPGGRRVRPAASKRTPFDPDGRASFVVNDAARARLLGLGAPLVRAAELVVPGSSARLRVGALIGAPGLERLALFARVGDVSIAIDLDEEIRGDEPFEIEARCARGTLLARFGEERGVLFVRAPLTKEETFVDPDSADALLVRHLLKNPEHPAIGRLDELLDARARLAALIDGAEAERASRPVRAVLVHVPRYRNRFDELMVPSLAIARLDAFLTGYGFEARVADLEAHHHALDLALFADDARVDRWLGGEPDAALESALETMWPTLRDAIEGPSVVGFSVVDYFGHFQMNLASCLARLVRERIGQVTVLGGERDQVDGERALGSLACFDHVVDGDGEEALYALLQLTGYGDRAARDIEGVWTRDGESIVKNRLVRSHLNAMPRPRFDGMPLERYRRAPSRELLAALAQDGLRSSIGTEPRGYLPYGFVKGCTAECTFCSAKEHLDVQAPEKTVDELLTLRERHGIDDFVFLNNLVNLGPRWLKTFCERLIAAGADLQWTDSCRPTGIDEELAHLMRASGCLLLNFGAESGSDAVLTRMKKGLQRDDILRTLRATHAAGIINRVNLIAGYLHETEADVDLTISLVEELAEPIDVIGCFQGFYLFEGMGVDPEAEGIRLREGLAVLKTGQTTLAYDEIGGRTWEEKRDSIDASRNRILARIEQLDIRTIDKIDEYDLFFLSRSFRDKAITSRYLLEVPRDGFSYTNQSALMPGGQRGRVEPAE